MIKNIKKLTAGVFAALIASVGIFVFPVFASGGAYVSETSVTVNIGETTSVSIGVNNAAGFYVVSCSGCASASGSGWLDNESAVIDIYGTSAGDGRITITFPTLATYDEEDLDGTTLTVSVTVPDTDPVDKKKIRFSNLPAYYTGFAKADNNYWYYLRNGKVADVSSVIQNQSEWWYVKNGRVDFTYNGVAKNENGWWKITGGVVDFNFQGFESNEYGWWYLEGGRVSFNKNDIIKGIANNEAGKDGAEGWWYIQDSKVTNTTTVAKNVNGWWYVKDGLVDFSFNGLGTNSYGTWYIQNGKVDFSFNGYAYGRTIRGGKAL